MPTYFDDMNLFGLILAQSYQYMADGQFANVEENLLTDVKFLNRLSREKFGFYVNVFQNICFDQMIPLITKVVKSNSLSRQFYQNFLEQLKITASKNIWDVLEGEKVHFLKHIKDMEENAKKEKEYNSNFWSDFYKDFDVGFDGLYKYRIEAFIKNNPEIYEQKVKGIKAQLEDLKFYSGPEPTINEYYKYIINISGGDASLASSFKLYQDTQSEKRINYYYIGFSKINIFMTAIAIKLFQLDNNKLPQSLEELVPKYLSKIPEDPFNNFSPLQYKKTDKGYLLYSFGPDRIDQSGQVIFDSNSHAKDTSGDIVFSFE